MTNCAFTGESLKNVNWAGNFNMGAVNREFDRYNPFFWCTTPKLATSVNNDENY